MKSSPIPYLGRTLFERRAPGLKAVLGCYPAGRQPLHVHAHPTFSMLVAGRGLDLTRNRAYDQPPLSVVFHPTTVPQANDVGPGGALGLTLEMEPAWLEAHALTETALGGYQPVAPSARSRLACLSLVAAAWRGGPSTAADLETLTWELVEFLIPPPGRSTLGSVPRWLSRGEDFLRAHFRSPVGLSQAAREAGVHPIHFARVFRSRHGCPVSAYVRALRLTEAGELILGGSPSLAQVACGAGFADQAHLTRWFSRVIGLSPGALRRLRLLAPAT